MRLKSYLSLLSAIVLLAPSAASGVSWKKTSVQVAPEAGRLSATAVDRYGRVHVAYLENTGIALNNAFINHEIRASAREGFEPVGGGAISFFSAGSLPLYLSMDVAPDLTVQIAIVDEDGSVIVFERAEDATEWTETEVAINACIDPNKGGVNIRSAGNGALRGALVFTGGTGILNNPGPARYVEQINPGSWGTPVTVFSGVGSGIAPVLVNTPQGVPGSAPSKRAIIAYDEVNERVHTSGLFVSSLFSSWSDADEIAPAEDLTRPDANYANGRIGVTFTQLQGGVSYATRQLKPGASGGTFNDYEWRATRAVPASEVDPSVGEFFGSFAPLAYDAGGEPIIGYTRNSFVLFVARTLQIKTKRRIPRQGWEDSVVEDIPSTTGTVHTTNAMGIDLVTSLNGDPALVYERDQGEDSTLVFARPITAPWVLSEPESLSDYSNTYAPALARGLNGDIHLVLSGATGGLLLGPPFSYAPSQLVTYSGGVQSVMPIPISNNPVVSRAINVTPDGTVHIIGLRLVDTTRTAGDLLYYRSMPDGTIDFSSLADEGNNHASPGPVILESDAAGNLYLAFLNTSGAPKVRKLPAGSSTWETLLTAPVGGVVGLDMAVRSDGGLCLSYYDAGARIVKAFTDVDLRSGARLTAFESINARTLAGTDREPADTACVFLTDGRPRLTYPAAGTLLLLTPRRIGAPSFTADDVAIGFDGGSIEMLAKGNEMHVLGYSGKDGGTCHHVQVEENFDTINDAFAVPGLALATLESRQSVAATLDENGSPVFAACLFQSFFIGASSNRVILARPADALDDDGDGISLLLEEAHCLNANFPDSPELLAQGNSLPFLTSVAMQFVFRHPAVVRSSSGAPSTLQYADFRYAYEAGNDLIGWGQEAEVTGRVFGLLGSAADVSGNPYCRTITFGRGYLPDFRTENPKRFARLRVTRDR